MPPPDSSSSAGMRLVLCQPDVAAYVSTLSTPKIPHVLSVRWAGTLATEDEAARVRAATDHQGSDVAVSWNRALDCSPRDIVMVPAVKSTRREGASLRS